MNDLDAALVSGSFTALLGTAVTLGFLHTILGPDHYVPFVMMAKAQKWSRMKAGVIALLCGIGHVGSSIVIGAGLIVAGMALNEWEGSQWATWHEARGSLAAWLLMGLGAVFTVWGLMAVMRGRTHSHAHMHEDGSQHSHEHKHTVTTHMHVHDVKGGNLTPWILFTIFIFGPCESLIPLMLASWAVAGLGGTVLVAGVFSLVTILTMLGTMGALMLGISRIPLGKLDRWSTTLAGLSLVLCGAAIQWMGL